MPIRAWTDDGSNTEYRYHPKCLGLNVSDFEPNYDFDDDF